MSKFRVGIIKDKHMPHVSQGRYLNIFFSLTTGIGFAKVIASYFYWVNISFSRNKSDAIAKVKSLQLDEVILNEDIKSLFGKTKITNIEDIDSVHTVIRKNSEVTTNNIKS